jgi:hypothetical protein
LGQPHFFEEVGVGLIGVLLRVELRHRWRSWLMVGLLVALVSGLVLAGIAAGRRTASAFPAFVQTYGYDAYAFAPQPIAGIGALPDVSRTTLLRGPAAGTPTCSCGKAINVSDFGLAELQPKDLGQFVKLVDGRMPDQSKPGEVLVSFTFAHDVGVGVGTRLSVPLYARSQRHAIETQSNATPRGPTVRLRVVGIEAADIEFQSSSYPYYDVYTTTAFDRAYNSRSFPIAAYYVRLHGGAADLPKFQTEARTLGALSVTDLDTTTVSNEASIHPQAVGWWLLAGVVGFVGVILVLQALVRQGIIESDTYATLSALGASRRQLVWLGVARTSVIAVAGALGGIVLAVLLSPLTPVGEARIAEPTTGFAFDALVLLVGAGATMVVILGLGMGPALRTATLRRHNAPRADHPSQTVGLLGRLGTPPSVLIGVGRAIERGRGRSAVPVGSAIVGMILAVLALSATAVFGASLSHLTTTPALYGQPFDAWFSVNSGLNSTHPSPVQKDILTHTAITRVTEGVGGDLGINGHTIDALAGESLRGRSLFTTIDGRLPRHDDEVTMGAATMRLVHAHVGTTVRVTAPSPDGGTRVSPYRVVGIAAFPPDFGAGGLGTGAIFSVDGLWAAQCAPGPSRPHCETEASANPNGTLLVRAARTPAGRQALATLSARYSSDVEFPMAPDDLVNFGEAVNFPLILSLVIILFGVAALMHVLFVSVARRRRESGVLKAIGFVRRQVALTVIWQTVTVVLIGVVVGVPSGIVVGRLAWRSFAGNLGVVPVPIVAGWTIGALALGAVAVGAALAVWPAFLAVRSHSARSLREE